MYDVKEDPTMPVPKDQMPAGMGFHKMSTVPIVRELKECATIGNDIRKDDDSWLL